MKRVCVGLDCPDRPAPPRKSLEGSTRHSGLNVNHFATPFDRRSGFVSVLCSRILLATLGGLIGRFGDSNGCNLLRLNGLAEGDECLLYIES